MATTTLLISLDGIAVQGVRDVVQAHRVAGHRIGPCGLVQVLDASFYLFYFCINVTNPGKMNYLPGSV